MKKVIKEIQIYQGKNGAIEFKADSKKETIWATQAQIAELFVIERSVVTKHINNLLKSNEVEKSNVQILHIANSDKPVNFYSLDVILSVGYRTNSKTAIEFRKWANKILKEHLTKGFTINKKLINKNYQEFLSAVESIQKLIPQNSENLNPQNTLELVKTFAKTWFSLDAYDKGEIRTKKVNKKKVNLTAKALQESLNLLKKDLIQKGEATDIFGNEKTSDALGGIIGNVMQSFGGKNVYESVEEKAAHLLYFMIKDHPFVDGNKRSGAFAFIWFLNEYKLLDRHRLSPEALTTLALLVAGSDPKQKENIIKLIMKMIEK